MNQHSCEHHFLVYDPAIQKNARKVAIVLGITFVTMIFEIYFGYITGSLALLADGWHMATHAAALGISYFTYRLATNHKVIRNFNFGGGKIIALGGYTSAIFLLMVVAVIIWGAVERLMNPRVIVYNEALWVAALGLIINLFCVYVLRDSHHGHSHGGEHENSHKHDHEHTHAHGQEHDHEHPHYKTHSHDHNIRGAYLHVLADVVTSVAAIAALLAGKYFNLDFLDPIIGLVGALVILKWAHQLIRDTGWELLDGHAANIDYEKLRKRIESQAQIVDLHVWRVAPKILACELIVKATPKRGIEHYRQILKEFHIDHTVIEERD